MHPRKGHEEADGATPFLLTIGARVLMNSEHHHLGYAESRGHEMKSHPRINLFLSLAALVCLGPACASSTKENGASDALAPADATSVEVSNLAPDASSRDAGAPDLAAAKPDAGPDLAVPKPDTASPDLAAFGPDTSPDLATPDVASPDVTATADGNPPQFDTLASRCVLDGGPSTLAHVSPLELKTLLDAGEDVFLINVKGASIDQIPGTDATFVNDIAGIEALVGNDLCANIVLYCLSGGTSQSVGTQLVAKGYRRVRDLSDGISAWNAAGYQTL
jgi:rhodanese-related sulfurtransferase